MEMLIVVFLLALSDKNTELKETLKKVLSFYRENRELLVMLANDTSGISPLSDPPAASAADLQTDAAGGASYKNESSSASGGDNLKLLEAFLKLRGV